MAKSMHLRGVPDDVHRTLAERAERSDVSLSAYVLGVLRDHCATPTMDEWLDEVESFESATAAESPAEAVRLSRDSDDESLVPDRRR